jgi:hypothetical protein
MTADAESPQDKTESRYFILEAIGTLTALLEEKDPLTLMRAI